MRKRIVIRADASKKTGYGHFYRSLALANHLRDDFECVFASYNEDEDRGLPSAIQLDKIVEICDPLPLGIFDDLVSFNNAFLKELKEEDIVVLDNYYYATDYQKKIKDRGCRLVCIDDLHDRHMVCDLLISGSPLKRSDFSLESYTDFRGGIEWIFLRDEFMSSQSVRNVRTEIQNITVGMGGSDAFNLTDKMIEIILDILPHVNIDVIAGKTVNVSNQYLSGIYVHRNISAQKIVQIFDKADIGIFPASTIGIEAISRKLPVIAGIYADNQKALYDYGTQNKLFAPLGNLLDDKEQIRSRLKNILNQNLPVPRVIDLEDQKQRTVELFKKLQ